MDGMFSKIGTGLTLSQKIERKVEEAIRQKNQIELISALKSKDSKKAYEVSVALLDRNMEIYKKYFKTS